MRILAILAVVGLVGCATPPGKLTEADFATESHTVKRPLQEVYAGLQSNARICGGLLGGHPAEWYPRADGATIDLYLPSFFGGRDNWVYGTIRLESDGTTTNAKVSVQKVYDRSSWRERAKRMFEEIAGGDMPSCK